MAPKVELIRSEAQVPRATVDPNGRSYYTDFVLDKWSVFFSQVYTNVPYDGMATGYK